MNCTLIKKSCVGLLAIILSTSCADLTENLTGQPTVDKFFQTLTDFNSYITGAYTPLILLYRPCVLHDSLSLNVSVASDVHHLHAHPDIRFL